MIDDIVVKDHLMNMVHQGKIRPNTPITWSYSKDDAWNFADDAFKYIVDKTGTLQTAETLSISALEMNSFYNSVYGSHMAEISALFGCSVFDAGSQCKERFARWVQATHWYCNTRWAFRGALTHENIGPIYPVQFEEPNCENGTKSCHCSEGAYVRGQRASAFGRKMKTTWGNFYKTGNSNLKSFSDMEMNAFNVVSSSKWTQEAIREWVECDTLDAVHNANFGYTFGY